MLLYEEQERQNKRLDIHVFATDIDTEAIDVARLGVYPASVARDVPDARLGRNALAGDTREALLEKAFGG